MGRRWRRRVSPRRRHAGDHRVADVRSPGAACCAARLVGPAGRSRRRLLLVSESVARDFARWHRRSPTSARTQVLRPSGALSFESVHSPASRSAICPGRFSLTSRSFRQTDNPSRFSRASGELKKIALSGGNPVTLVEKIAGSLWTFGVWIASGTIVFGGPGTAGLKQVPADGGSPTTLTSIDVAQGEFAHYPGRPMRPRRALWSSPRRSVSSAVRGSEAVILQSGERRVITENARGGRYLSTGHLVFTRGDAVLVAPIDVKRLVLTGPAAALSDDVRRDGANSEGTRPAAGSVVERHARVCPESRRHGARDGTCRPRRGIHALRTGRWSEPAATRLARRSACGVRIAPARR